MPKKPDRFERMLIKRMREVGFPNPTREGMKHAAMSYEHVARLLRAEHVWMRGMVQQEPEMPGPMPFELYAKIQCSSILQVEEILRCVVRATKKSMLDKLAQRRK